MTSGREKVVREPNSKTKITFEQHPYHPIAPEWHRCPHLQLRESSTPSYRYDSAASLCVRCGRMAIGTHMFSAPPRLTRRRCNHCAEAHLLDTCALARGRRIRGRTRTSRPAWKWPRRDLQPRALNEGHATAMTTMRDESRSSGGGWTRRAASGVHPCCARGRHTPSSAAPCCACGRGRAPEDMVLSELT
jgi:hypothetical protein